MPLTGQADYRPTRYENVQKGIGAMMRGSLIQTEARTILNRGISQGISETKKETALRMLKMGKLTVEEIAPGVCNKYVAVCLSAGVCLGQQQKAGRADGHSHATCGQDPCS